jgi:hypothetical protein
MVGSRHLAHAQKGGGGVTNAFHSRDELHRIPGELCDDVVRWCERAAPSASCMESTKVSRESPKASRV